MMRIIAASWLYLTLMACATSVMAEGDCPLSADGCPSTYYYGDKKLTRRFFLEYKTPLAEFCKELEGMEDILLEAYNVLSRVHCDKTCYRSAIAARIKTFCGPDHPDIELSDKALQQERTAIVELDFQLSYDCPYYQALDTAADDDSDRSTPHDFEGACDFEPIGWGQESFEYPYHKDKGYPVNKKDPCCCPCDVTQPLAEDDLVWFFNFQLKKAGKPCDFTTINELETPPGYCGDKQEFHRVVLTEWTGNPDTIEPITLVDLDTILRDVYNGHSFDQCDGRQMVETVTDEVVKSPPSQEKGKRRRHLQASPAGYVTEYPQSKCDKACTETEVTARAICKESCPSPLDIALFEKSVNDGRRLLKEDPHDSLSLFERQLYYSYDLDSVINVIYDHCLCRHHFAQPMHLYDLEDWIDIYNDEIVTPKRDLWKPQIGAIGNLTEYVKLPADYGPYDDHYSTLVHVNGSLCEAHKYTDKKGWEYVTYSLDESLVYDLVEVIRRSYNDLVIEKCDAGWFRQLIAAAVKESFFKGYFDCHWDEYALELNIDFRCHGHCDTHDPLFAPHPYYHARRRLTRNMAQKKPTANVKPMVKSAAAPEERNLKKDKDEKDKDKEHEYYPPSPPDGLCELTSASTPSPPTLAHWEAHANTYKPSAVEQVTILYGYSSLCWCETPDYKTPEHVDHYAEYYLLNGVYVYPKHKHCPDSGATFFNELLFFC